MDGSRQSPDALLALLGDGSNNGASAKLCMAVGCDANLSDLPKYCQQRRLCPEHLKAPAIKRKQHEDDTLWRFCQQCGKLEPLHAFDGTKRSCRLQLAKRRASSFNKGSATSSSTAVSSLSKTVSRGVRKTASFNNGNLDRAGLNSQFSDPQLQQSHLQQQLNQLQQQQQSSADFFPSTEYQESDLSGRLIQLKQQVAVMEQQLALLQEQQQMEAELMSLQQQYQRTLQDAQSQQQLQSSPMPEANSAISAPLGNMGFSAHNADRTLSAPVPCLSAPVFAPAHAPVPRRPSAGASAQIWSAATPGMLGGMSGMSLPGPLMQSCSTPLAAAAGAGAAAAGFGTMGHGAANGAAGFGAMGWLPYDSCVSNGTVMSSIGLSMQQVMPPAAAAAARVQLTMQPPQHTDIWSVAHSMQMNNVPMINDMPDLQDFFAAGGRLQADCSASQNVICNDSSPSHSRHLHSLGGSYSPERPPAGPHGRDPTQGAAARVQEHAQMLHAPMQAAAPMQIGNGRSFAPAHSTAAFAQTLDVGHGANSIPFGSRSLETFAGLLEEVLQEIHAEGGSDLMQTA